MIAGFRSLHQRFQGDERGSIAPVFGLTFAVMLLGVGFALDYGRVVHASSKARAAADAAALAGGRALLDGRLTDAQVRDLTLKYFNENLKSAGKFGSTGNVDIAVDRANGVVRVNAVTSVGMAVMQTAGFDKIDVPIAASVASDQQDIELGMALDVTGSMAGQKIADLRAAAKDLVDILLPDGGTPNKVRIGLAPYAASVNAGAYARVATNNQSNACVHERGGVQAFTDAAPEFGSFLGWRAGLSCPTATVQPLTDDKAVLKSRIDGYGAAGSTAGHIGAAWASYLVSPAWNTVWPAASRPAPYTDGKTLKAIILMTDGEFNTQYVGANGNSAAQARSICSETRDRNVVVYSVAFQSPAAAETLLRDCAGSSSRFFSASNGSELRQAFVEIAQQLNNLRLTQ